MRRRDLMAALGSTALIAPFRARAEPPARPTIGFVNSRSPADAGHLLAGFQTGLADTDFVDGQNVTVEYRWAMGQYQRVPALTAELIGRPVDILVATGGEPVALAAKAATATIPIVFIIGSDPIKLGLAASFSRPGGNSTGVSMYSSEISAKRLGLLRELVPQASRIGVLANPAFLTTEAQLKDIREGGRTLGIEIEVFPASTGDEIDAAFNSISEQHLGGLMVTADPFFDTRRGQILTLVARHRLPAMYQLREYAADGGLISYGIDLPDVYRQIGGYAGKILKGAKPADLPIMQPTRFQLVINRRTAKTLGLNPPLTIFAGASEVIE